MRNLRFAEKLASEPWYCDAAHVEFLHQIFLRYLDRAAAGERLDPLAVEQMTGKPLENTRTVTNKDGVARIPVEGTIVRRASLFSEVSGAVSTETIAKDFIAAYEDDSVHSILFVFDTPGGEAYGINELATLILQKREEGTKRIEAFCDGMCASAGYYLASATERITAETSSSVGSIGTVVRVWNPQAAGRSPYLDFVNARSPNKRPDPNTASGRNAIQEWIDDLGDQFIGFVADARGVGFETVVDDFGQGFVMTGRRALEAGMVDALGVEGEVVGRLQEEGGLLPKARGVKGLRPAALADGGGAGALRTTNGPKEAKAGVDEVNGVDGRRKVVAGEEGVAQATERNEAGFFAHMRAFFMGDGAGSEPGATLDVVDGGEGERTEGQVEKTAAPAKPEADEAAELRAELAEERRRREEAETRAQVLAGENADTARRLLEERVDNELKAFCDGGTPKYLADLAREDLLAGGAIGADDQAVARAGRWRTALEGAKGTVSYGENGAGAQGAEDEASDHDRVKAELEARGLGPEHYGTVAAELVAAGSIRRGG